MSSRKRQSIGRRLLGVRRSDAIGYERSSALRDDIGIATRAMQRANIETPVHGAHVLRHSAATHMLRHDVPVPVIGAVLRHASMETTAGYAKVDLSLLQYVVQPWPEVETC